MCTQIDADLVHKFCQNHTVAARLFAFKSINMIKGILIINNHGRPRLVKFYHSVVSFIMTNLRK